MPPLSSSTPQATWRPLHRVHCCTCKKIRACNSGQRKCIELFLQFLTVRSAGKLQRSRTVESHLLCNLRNTHTHTNKTLTSTNLFALAPMEQYTASSASSAFLAKMRFSCVLRLTGCTLFPPKSTTSPFSKCRLLLLPNLLSMFPLFFPLYCAIPTIKIIYACSPGNPYRDPQ